MSLFAHGSSRNMCLLKDGLESVSYLHLGHLNNIAVWIKRYRSIAFKSFAKNFFDAARIPGFRTRQRIFASYYCGFTFGGRPTQNPHWAQSDVQKSSDFLTFQDIHIVRAAERLVTLTATVSHLKNVRRKMLTGMLDCWTSRAKGSLGNWAFQTFLT